MDFFFLKKLRECIFCYHVLIGQDMLQVHQGWAKCILSILICIERINIAKKTKFSLQKYLSQNREIVGSEAFLAVIWSQKVKILFFLLLRFK